jgi:PAS domain S-box-containing protein
VLSETSSPRLFGGVAIDISARVREEENLRSKEEHLRNLIERNHDLTLVLNLEGVITFCSPASRFVLGAEPDQIVGTPFNLGMSPEALVEWEKRLKKLNQKAGNYDQFEIKYLHKEGNWIYLDVAATNCHHVRTLSGLVLYLRNISSWKEIEQQLVRKNNQLLEIAWLQSDPIRKPISNIISLTESVADQLPALSKERESLRVVRDEALQLEKLVTEIARKANMLMG